MNDTASHYIRKVSLDDFLCDIEMGVIPNAPISIEMLENFIFDLMPRMDVKKSTNVASLPLHKLPISVAFRDLICALESVTNRETMNGVLSAIGEINQIVARISIMRDNFGLTNLSIDDRLFIASKIITGNKQMYGDKQIAIVYIYLKLTNTDVADYLFDNNCAKICKISDIIKIENPNTTICEAQRCFYRRFFKLRIIVMDRHVYYRDSTAKHREHRIMEFWQYDGTMPKMSFPSWEHAFKR
jgi:hypothetical protein